MLTPVPGPRGTGAPRLETGTSRTKAFVDARRGVTFSFRLVGRLGDLAQGRARERRRRHRRSRPGPRRPWRRTSCRASPGTAASAAPPAKPGRYSFRLTAAGADGARSRAARRPATPQRDAFDLYDHIFPIRGAHDFGGARRPLRRRARRPQPPGPGRVRQVRHPAGGRARRARQVQAVPRAGRQLRRDRRRRHGRRLRLHAPRRAVAVPRRATASTRASTIGAVGDTGDAVGCHLHFELWTRPGLVRRRPAVRPAAVAARPGTAGPSRRRAAARIRRGGRLRRAGRALRPGRRARRARWWRAQAAARAGGDRSGPRHGVPGSRAVDRLGRVRAPGRRRDLARARRRRRRRGAPAALPASRRRRADRAALALHRPPAHRAARRSRAGGRRGAVRLAGPGGRAHDARLERLVGQPDRPARADRRDSADREADRAGIGLARPLHARPGPRGAPVRRWRVRANAGVGGPHGGRRRARGRRVVGRDARRERPSCSTTPPR